MVPGIPKDRFFAMEKGPMGSVCAGELLNVVEGWRRRVAVGVGREIFNGRRRRRGKLLHQFLVESGEIEFGDIGASGNTEFNGKRHWGCF
jgi:hypothetical protein